MWRHVIVTGGAGFIGSNLIRQLLDRRLVTRITSVDDYSSGCRENHIESERVQYIRTHTSEIDGWIAPPIDVIFHFGEYSRIATSFEDFDQIAKGNMGGTAMVIREALKLGARLVYAGSSSIFADPNLSPYAFSKKTNIDLIKNFSSWHGLDYKITYFYNVYGPGQIVRGRMATVIGIFQRQWLSREKLTIVRPGDQRRDLTHVDDVVDGIIRAAQDQNGINEFQLCTGTSYSVEEIAAAFFTDVTYVDERPGERFNSFGSNDVARKILGWEPKHDVLKYISQWMMENEHKRRRP